MAERHLKQGRIALLNRLNQEWAVQCDERVPHCWGEQEPTLPSGRLEDVLASVRQDPDAVLGALIRLLQGGDELAGRIVLQSLLGGLVRSCGGRAEAVEDRIGQAWLVIRSYPIERRPIRIAANVILDSLKASRREQVRAWAELSVAAAELDQAAKVGDEDPPASARQVLDAAACLGLIDSTTASVLTTVYADAVPGREAAARHETSPAALRQRCSVAVRRLARHRSSLAALL